MLCGHVKGSRGEPPRHQNVGLASIPDFMIPVLAEKKNNSFKIAFSQIPSLQAPRVDGEVSLNHLALKSSLGLLS